MARCPAFEGRASLRTWLLGIVSNKARTRFVREGRTVAFSALSAADDDATCAAASVILDATGSALEGFDVPMCVSCHDAVADNDQIFTHDFTP